MINIFKKFSKQFLRNSQPTLEFSQLIREQNNNMSLLIGKQLSNQIILHGIYENIHDAEFKVFSQFGDDGILQYLIHQTNPDFHTFIEFGVQDYSESNTLFLMQNNNWSGLIIDGDLPTVAAIRTQNYYWRFDLTAVGTFITRENINQLFRDNGFSGEIGLLSVDIDGNDYWVWEAIDSVNPVIVTVEYNSVFGSHYPVTIPYDPTFNRTKAHYSNLYWGTSLKALCLLAEKKGYAFVGCNSNGNNAHFVRKDKIGKLPILTVEEGFVESRFRESRDINGNLTFLRGRNRLELIKEMSVTDIVSGKSLQIKDIIQ